MAEIELRIKQFVLENFVFNGNLDDIKSDQSFMESGIIDSLGVIELITFVEEQYGIAIPDDDVLPENFDSVNNVVRYIWERAATAVLA